MRIKTLLITVVIVLGYNHLFGQNLKECKVDFFLLESQESFSTDDNGRKYVLIFENIPEYEIKEKPTKTLEQIKAEFSEKLKDNKDYNKNNPKVKDSLINYYTELAHNIGVNLVWWEKWKKANEFELKEYKKRKRHYNRQAKTGYIPKGAIQDPNYQSTSYYEKNSGYGRYWDSSIPIPEIIDERSRIKGDSLYKRKEKRIRDDLPIFWVKQNESNLKVTYDRENYEYNFPIGIIPIFDFSQFKNSTFTLHNEEQGNYSSNWDKLEFLIDDKSKLSVYNFKLKKGYYQPNIDYSIDIFYDKKKLAKIDEFLNSLKSKKLVIQSDGEEYINIQLIDISFNLKSLKISFISDEKKYTKVFEGYSDPNYRYDNGWPNRRAKQVYNFPIYYTDCYNKKLDGFKNLTLKNDYINNSSLKKQLYNALISSPEWLNFSIEKVIFTNKSQWVIVSNKYTGVKKSRFMLADIYAKSTKTGKCYLQKEVFFSQKLDPFGEYTYSIFVSVPQTMEPYPCNLN